MSKYSEQIFCVWGNKVSLDAAFKLQKAEEKENTPPLELHHGTSRFVLTILDKTSGTTIPNAANLPALDLPEVVAKTQVALMRKESYIPIESSGENLSPAYTKVFPYGTFANRTPADVLLEAMDNKEAFESAAKELERTRKFLNDNLKKYPANKDIIEAINDAFELCNKKELKPQTKIASAATSSMIVYQRDYKHKMPEKDGMKTIYSIKILCDFTKKYPWEVTISNCFAPLITKDGRTMPDMSKSKDKHSGTIRLSDGDWLKCVDRLNTVQKLYEDRIFNEMYSRMCKERNAWKNEDTEKNTKAS